MQGAITLDFHNTLVRCDEWFELEVRELPVQFLHWRGHPVDAALSGQITDQYRQMRGQVIESGIEIPAEECLRIVFGENQIDMRNDEIAEGLNFLMSQALREASVIDGAASLVNHLHRAGVKLGVVSSAIYHRFLIDALDKFGLLELLSTVVTSASAGFYKSNPEIYRTALIALGAEAAESVHVGDSLRFDVGGAAAAGMRTAWFNPNGDSQLENRHSPDLIITDLAESADDLLELLGGRTALLATE